MDRLFEKKSDCCACGACVNACPKNAVSMKEDKYGFLYPDINSELCVDCQMCRRVCAFQNIKETNTPLKTWVAVSKNSQILSGSASGGVFFTTADELVKKGGCVVGAAFDKDFNLCHVIAEETDTLSGIQGSKYMQSSTGTVFRDVRHKLDEGRMVLFSGCPCQVAGLKSFLKKDYDNLILMDLICHGVPSNKAFKDYLKQYENNNRISVRKFNFRDKSLGWGKNGSLFTERDQKKKLYETDQSYLYYFGQGLLMRESCYSCRYSCSSRPGDITIGDYWGIVEEHPELLKKINEKKGVSVIIANTEKGIDFINKNSYLFDIFESEYKKAAKGNAQLNHPLKHSEKRDAILDLYARSGWEAVNRRFNENIGIRRYIGFIKSVMPQSIKRIIKKIKH